MFKFKLLLITGVMIFKPSLAFCQANFPETPSGHQIQELLSQVENGDEKSIKSFIEEEASGGIIERNSIERLVNLILQMHDMEGKIYPYQVNSEGEHKIEVTGKNKNAGLWVKLFLETEPSTGNIVSFGIEQTNEPANYDGSLEKYFNNSEKGESTQSLSKDEILANLDEKLKDLTSQDRFSGGVLIADRGEILFQEVYGFANKRYGVKNKLDTKFNLASNNKMFTGVAIVQLAEQGKLKFDDKIIDHIPDYENKGVAEKVTIHQLLTHTSGLGFYPFDHNKVTLEGILKTFVDQPLQFEPGTGNAYSNAAFVVLGIIVERITGMSYYEYIDQNIFRPAGMINSGFYRADEIVPNMAIGYTKYDTITGERNPEAEWSENTFQIEYKGSSAGGGYSTLEDMMKFGEALRNNILVGEEYTKIMFNGGSGEENTGGFKSVYGFGNIIMGNAKFIGHQGGASGVAADFALFDNGFIMVTFGNYDFEVIEPHYRDILSSVTDLF